MSYYQNLWKEAQEDLRIRLEYDRLIRKKGPIKDVETAKWIVGHLFMGYVRIVNKLDECYDQIIHPQKREVIGRLLDCALGRLLEIKSDIVRIEQDDFVFFDNILIELRLTPDDVQIKVPEYYWRDREKTKAHRRKLISKVYEELKEEEYKAEYLKDFPPEERDEAWARYLHEKESQRLAKEKTNELYKRGMDAAEQEKPKKGQGKNSEPQPLSEIGKAVLLIQRHERARQGRRDLPLHKRRKIMRMTGRKYSKVPDELADEAAVVIQAHWRRHRRRVLGNRKLEREMLLLGMIQPSWKELSSFDKMQEVLRYRRELQDRNTEEYEEALTTIKEKMTKLYSASMTEDITDEIRNWFEWFFLNSDYLPDFPDPEPIVPTGDILGIPKVISKAFIEKAFPQKKKGAQQQIPNTKMGLALSGIQPIGGSALVVAEHWIGPTEFLICQKEVERIKKSGGGAAKADTGKMSKEEKAALKKKEKEAEKRRLLAEAAEGFRMKDSSFLMPLIKADKDYTDFWLDIDESHNYDQKYIYDLIKDEKCWELSMQVREVVDEAMRLELEILKEALEKDKNPKKKYKPKRKGKPKKGKKGKKDPTGDRTNDDLFCELFKNGIIREFEEAHLKDYVGERSYSAFQLRRNLQDGFQSSGDVRDVILQLCILPLGSNRIHQLFPVIRSVCLLGPNNCGKEFLARVICTETASVMFDLTPENTAGKYTSKSEMKMLVHLIEKMSRILQPSVILVDGAEKLFYKKVPKEEKQYDPKRFGKVIGKIAKGIKQEDQVLIVGVSSYPWLCPKPKLIKTYDKFIYIPQPDYATYYMLWQKLLIPYHSLSRDFDFSCLARVSTGYSVKAIIDVVKKVMTPDRISRSRVDPYKPSDFMDELCKTEPLQEKIISKCIGFYDKTNMRKNRLQNLEQLRLAQEKAKKKK